jgi:glycerol-3-phosphate dehydrogenase
MAQDLCKLVFKNINKKYSKNLSLTPFEKKSIIYDIHKQNLSKEILDNILEQELVRTKDDLIKRRLSLYSLDQAQNSNEIKDLIDQLPSI